MKKLSTKIALCIAVLAVAIISTSATIQQNRQKKILSILSEEATPIQEGVLTEKQKEHSKIYKGYASIMNGRKIKGLIAERGDVDIWAPIGLELYMPPVSLDKYLQTLTCDADAAIIGFVKSKSSNLVESGTFLFTDYEVTVKEILKENATAPAHPGDEITITRGGGAVRLNKRIVRAIDPSLGRLEVGRYYLLYLKYIPATGGYRHFANEASEDSFLLDGGTISQISRKQLPLGPRNQADAVSFLSEARNALTQKCKQGGARK